MINFHFRYCICLLERLSTKYNFLTVFKPPSLYLGFFSLNFYFIFWENIISARSEPFYQISWPIAMNVCKEVLIMCFPMLWMRSKYVQVLATPPSRQNKYRYRYTHDISLAPLMYSTCHAELMVFIIIVLGWVGLYMAFILIAAKALTII